MSICCCILQVFKPSEKFAKIFQFEWDETDDTGNDFNPLYAKPMQVAPLFGRGYIAGYDMKEQRKQYQFVEKLAKRRQQDLDAEIATLQGAAAAGLSTEEYTRQAEDLSRLKSIAAKSRSDIEKLEKTSIGLRGSHWSEKKLEDMTERDWRIFREDFDIRLRGGRIANPLRYWDEANLPKSVMDAIVAAGYKQPSPIQRQAIPIGLRQRDIIGVAETGSGKTCDFIIPLLVYISKVPKERYLRVDEDGPLAVIMAPTRELAQQVWCMGKNGRCLCVLLCLCTLRMVQAA